MVKTICTKKVKNIEYELVHFKGDDKYVIYKWDETIMKDGKTHKLPEEAIFSNEKDAKRYLEKL